MTNPQDVHGGCQLIDRSTGHLLIESLELATTFWRRFCGWQFRALPPAGSGILLFPCNSIHTFGMRFAIDVAFFDSQGQVIHVAADLQPWRVVWPVRGAVGAIEIRSGACPLVAGMRIAVCGLESSVPALIRAPASMMERPEAIGSQQD